jgi:ferric-dicitrate binding protein FerR (iron transport regulator)
MRAVAARAQRCDRAREWISLQLDGELSEFERIVLEAHVARCGDCRAFRVDLRGISRELRHAPLEPLERPIVLPRRTRFDGRTLQYVAAAVAAIAVGVGSSLGVISTERSGNSTLRHRLRPAYLDSAVYEMQLIKQHQNVRLLAAISRAN